MASTNDNNDIEILYDLSGGNDDEEGTRGGKLSALPETTVMEKVTFLTAILSVGSSIAAMIVLWDNFVLIAGILSIIVGPYAYWQRVQFTDINALKETHAALVSEVNTLHSENVRMSENVKQLAGNLDRLADVENALDVINESQGKSVESFRAQVEVNKDLLSSMENNLKATVLQNLLDVVISSDSDGNDRLDENEINSMIRRLHSISGVAVDDDKLRLMIAQKNGSVDSMIDVMKDVVHNENEGVDHIFTFKE